MVLDQDHKQQPVKISTIGLIRLRNRIIEEGNLQDVDSCNEWLWMPYKK